MNDDIVKSALKRIDEERRLHGMKYDYEPEAAYASDAGADLDALDAHDAAFKGMIEDMFEKMPREKKILEGSKVPEYNPVIQNGFSTDEQTDEQWKNVSPSGSLTTGPIPVSTADLSSFLAMLKALPQGFLMASSDVKSETSSTDSCSEKLDDAGNETAAMSESSACTVPMISEQTDGTLSEAKWSPPLKSTESSDPTPLDVKS